MPVWQRGGPMSQPLMHAGAGAALRGGAVAVGRRLERSLVRQHVELAQTVEAGAGRAQDVEGCFVAEKPCMVQSRAQMLVACMK